MKYDFLLALVISTPFAWGQAPQKTSAPAPVAEISVKKSPAEDALVKAAKEVAGNQAAYDALLQQARTTLENDQKGIAKKLTDAQNDLNEKLKADKKYKPMVDNIIALQTQLSDAAKTVQNNFNQESGPLQQKINTNNALIRGLVPVVRQENNLSDNANFDTKTQKWKK